MNDSTFASLASMLQDYKNLGPYPQVRITAVGGIPVDPTNPPDIRAALGESAFLTRLNPRGKTAHELGDMLGELGHLWAYNWINPTLTFVHHGAVSQLAWGRDKRFWMSWSERTDDIWSATGSLKDWQRYTRHMQSPDFPAGVQKSMRDARSILTSLDPRFFTTVE